MRKEEKAQIIETIAAQIAENPNFYLADISGLNAENTSNLRRACFEKEIKLVVVKIPSSTGLLKVSTLKEPVSTTKKSRLYILL